MTNTQKDRIEREARQRLRRDEEAGAARPSVELADAWRGFWRHPSPWVILVLLVATWGTRVVHGQWDWGDILVPVVLVAVFPVVEWVIHVCLLHFRPRRVGRVTIDPLLARSHREHHADPRDVPLVFIPWQTYLWLVPALVAVALLAFPRLGLGLTWLGSVAVLGLLYEWTHYLIHSEYRPRTKAYRAVWRNHRLHHYKNERYWFSVTTSGTSDRLFGTYPQPSQVETSPTARNLHGDMLT